MSRNIVYINTTEKQMNQFAIGYMINPTLNVNRVLRAQVKKVSKEIFHQSIMIGIRMLWETRIHALLH